MDVARALIIIRFFFNAVRLSPLSSVRRSTNILDAYVPRRAELSRPL